MIQSFFQMARIFPLLAKKACLILLRNLQVVVHNKSFWQQLSQSLHALTASSKPSDETPFTAVSNHQIMEGSVKDQKYKREAPFTPFTLWFKPCHNSEISVEVRTLGVFNSHIVWWYPLKLIFCNWWPVFFPHRVLCSRFSVSSFDYRSRIPVIKGMWSVSI